MYDRMPQTPRSAVRAEKVRRLSRVIVEGAEACGAKIMKRPVSCLVIAKCPTSAVADAIAAVRNGGEPLELEVRAIFAEGAEKGWPSARGEDQIRTLRDPELHEAHERLIVGTALVWTGDCLRRPADKIDAYECLEKEDEASVLWAARSFAKLWAIAKPVENLHVGSDASVASQDDTPRRQFFKAFGNSR